MRKVRALSVVVVLLLALFAVGRTPTLRAQAPDNQVVLSNAGGSVVNAPASPFAPVTLQVDDGSAEDAVGLTGGGTFVWLNRFTPTVAQYPFTLNQVEVLFTSDGACAVGDAMDIYVYTDADGNPANGATPAGSITGQTVQALDTWSTYLANITLTGPGDVLIAVVNRGCNADGQFPAAIDTTASQGRSYVGFGAGATGNPPTIPTGTFGTIDSFGFPGNWMIRGLGETGGGATATATMMPTMTATLVPTATMEPTATMPPTAIEVGQIESSQGNGLGWLVGVGAVVVAAMGFVITRRR